MRGPLARIRVAGGTSRASMRPLLPSCAAATLLLVACASSPPPPPAPVAAPPPAPITAPVTAPPPAPEDAAVVAPQDAATEPTHAASPPDDVPAPAVASTERVRMYRGRSEDEWVRLMNERPVVRTIARYHSTLYVFHMDLGDGVEISFQPEQTRLESFWRREITSYHLARLLGIENRVPPTIGKRVPLSAFGRLGRGTNLVVDREGMVYGSASVWVPVLHGAQMHEAPARREWSGWMNPANPIPERVRERARQVAEVLVFDYLAANYDRWNCCNIAVDENSDLVFRDNDAGWLPRVINTLGSPGVTRRVPRYLWESLQRATPEALRASVARDPMAGRVHLVASGAYEGYERRRQAMIANLRRMIARYGEAAVLAWP